MTKFRFKAAMMRGLGRCITELDTCPDKEKYREIVLWGCLHNLSYDAQIEGTRSKYMYNLQNRFNDNFFETHIIQKFMMPLKDIWLFDHLCGLLYYFADDGSKNSENALYGKYELLKQNPDTEQLEWLCIRLTSLGGYDVFKKICSEIPQVSSFDWFYENSKDKFGAKRVEKILKINDYDVSLHNIIKDKVTITELTEAVKKKDSSVIAMAIRFSKTASEHELAALADIIITEQDEEVRAKYLRVFYNVQFPGGAEILIEYSKSSNPDLRFAAFSALENIKSDIVHAYAISILERCIGDPDGISLLCSNYRKEDKELLVSAVKSLGLTCKSDWHGAFSNVLELIEKQKDAPKELLHYLYENTLCSYCRECILREMGRKRMLTKEILYECLFDSNENIRRFAKRKSRN